ncbi:acyl- oxidase [Fusarium austroafricanum]|uniref:Acyl- oxidase n=1 Tax=Fusarium austroafricanum TaxID=2364996 RepID=A0A8H4KHU9_9HYPO|nr:acyl- oxidase [Fusarium austroafricanum]
MSSKNHLKIFTHDSSPPGPKPTSFPKFASLPTEIRLNIWKWTLRHQRIIQIRLHMHLVLHVNRAENGLPVPPIYPGENDPSYYPVVQGQQVLSKLLRVNKESRMVALSFYRVHLPCWLTRGASKKDLWVPGTVYYNPEYDFLHIQQDTMHFVDFVYKLKTDHDPRHIGLRNLALCSNMMGTGLHGIQPSRISPPTMKAFREVLAGLHEVWFVNIQTLVRQLCGRETGWPIMEETFFDRSFPIAAMSLRFDRIGQDPRPISNDLRGLHTINPYYQYESWLRALDKLGVKRTGIQYRFLLAFTPGNEDDDIYNYEDATKWLKKEDDIWTGKYKSDGPFSSLNLTETPASELPRFRDEDLNKAVRPAIGFWLFPVDAFCKDSSSTGSHPSHPRITGLDIAEHWPELAVSRISS